MKKIMMPILLINCLIYVSVNGQSFGIESFTLVNHNTDEDVRLMGNPDTTFGAFYDYNIRANTFGEIGSVKFHYHNILNNSSWSRIENEAPFALGGDHNGDYDSWWTIPGDYILTATPYSDNNGKGSQGTPLSIKMVVIFNANPPVIQSFVLVDPITDVDIKTLSDYDTLFTGIPLNIRINTDHEYGTLKIKFGEDYFKTEIWPPFAVGGDELGNYFSWFPDKGEHILTATPFSERYGVDGIMGIPQSIRLIVLDHSSTKAHIENYQDFSNAVIYPNPAMDELNVIWNSPALPLKIEISDLTGVVHLENIPDSPGIPTINLKSLNPGTYFVRVQTATGMEQYKFFKK